MTAHAQGVAPEIAGGPRHAFVPIEGHEIHVSEWGDPGSPALVMWHGLARTGRDFDELAHAFSMKYFVLCPDTIGRGLSSWATGGEYSVSNYARLAEALLDAYGIERVGWIGTSMGGLIGAWIASGDRAGLIDWLVINDIGPEVPQEAIDRILQYSATPPRLATLKQAEAALRTIYAPFGPASDAFWRRMAMTSVRRLPDGALTTHFDPAIVEMMTTHRAELTVWDRWDRITCPVHVLGGVTSDILLRPIAERMATTGPKACVSWWEDCGHAPTLSRDTDIARLQDIVRTLKIATQRSA